MENKEHIEKLLVKLEAGTASEAELSALIHSVTSANATRSAMAIDEFYGFDKQAAILNTGHSFEYYDTIVTSILQADRPVEPVSGRMVHRAQFLRRNWLRYAAAFIILLSGIAAYLLINNKENRDSHHITQITTDIPPGTNRATLTVGNKRPIDLLTNKKGIVTGTAVTYSDGEKIADAGEMLQLVTPRGGQYQAVLPDGTKVWLNAASSIRFPSTFAHDKREVEVSGEVYMEVAKNPASPFRVITGKATIQVLGTSFNIKAYPDEETQHTTLVSGSVKVLAIDHNVILQPGQQAVVAGKAIKVKAADIEQILAWKNGLFNFEGASFVEAMKQLERWYDLEIIYQGSVPDIEFFGKMNRNVPLSVVLKAIEGMGGRLRIEGKRLIIVQ